MANNDLFAPPTADEMKLAPAAQNDLFAPPTKDELAMGGKQIAPGQAQTALEHAGNAMSLGYLPQLQAAAEPLMTKGLNAITGNNVKPDDYITARDANIQRLAAESKANPKTATAADLAGGAVGAMATPVPGMGAASGLVGGAAKGALYGVGQGLVANPGDVQGQINPLQLSARGKNAAEGGIVGAVTGGVAGGTRGVLNAVENAPVSLRETAANQAVKASGGMLKDFRQLAAQGAIKVAPGVAGGAAGGAALGAMNGNVAKDAAIGGAMGGAMEKFSPNEPNEDESRLQDIGKFALDNKIVESGDTTHSIAQKATAFNEDAGKRLDQIYQATTGKALAGASPEIIQKINDGGFNPVRDRDQVLSSIKNSLGDSADKKSAVNAVSDYFDQLTEDYGNRSLTPKEMQSVKTAMDQQIRYARNPMQPRPAAEAGFSSARQHVSQAIDNDIQNIGEASGDPSLLNKLKEANRDYGYSKQLSQMATDKIQRERANRGISLTDTIAGGAGAGVGEGIGGMVGHGGVKERAAGTILGAAGGAAVNKAGRTYGPATIADIANKLGPALESTNVPAMAEGLNYLLPNDQVASRSMVQALQNKRNEKQKQP